MKTARKNYISIAFLFLFSILTTGPADQTYVDSVENKTQGTENPVPGAILLNEDGSWCWFQDERAIIDGDQLLFTGVTSSGENTVTSYHFPSGQRQTVVVNDETFEANDHNVGALLVRPDGRYLTVYAGHNVESRMRYRITTSPGDISEWGIEHTADTGDRNTYSNVYRLAQTGLTYNFHRGNGYNPNYMISGDDGETWRYGGRLISYPGRPYVRYTSNDFNRIHFITTEGHPRDYDNSIYHGYLEYDYLFSSDGTPVGRLSKDDQSDIIPQHFTRVFAGNAKNIAWTSDIELDQYGHPYIAFSVTRDPISRGEREHTEEGGFDHRYHYARWDGDQWHENEIAYAGTRLYPGENEYTGNIALHPDNPDVVYISTDVHPETGEPLLTDGEQRYEIFRGDTGDGGKTWKWSAVTENSGQDNIRPIVVADTNREVVMWLHGRYTTFRDYRMKVYGLINER